MFGSIPGQIQFCGPLLTAPYKGRQMLLLFRCYNTLPSYKVLNLPQNIKDGI